MPRLSLGRSTPDPDPAPAPAPVTGPATRPDAQEAVPYGLRIAAGVAWRVIVLAILAWGLGHVLAATRTVGIPVAVGLLLTALTMPVMVLLNHRLGLGRPTSRRRSRPSAG